MSLKHAVLAALSHNDVSGYGLSKIFDIAIASFWHATSQQIYAELNRMEREGLVAATTVIQEGRPNKRVYHMTDAGRQALHDWGAEPPGPPSVKDELIIKLYGGEAIGPEPLISQVRTRRAAHVARLAHYEQIRATLLQNDDEQAFIQKGVQVGPYLALTSGLSYEAAAIAWCDQTLALLAAWDPMPPAMQDASTDAPAKVEQA